MKTDEFLRSGPGSLLVNELILLTTNSTGNIYYVGAVGISSHIIATSEGLILLDPDGYQRFVREEERKFVAQLQQERAER